MKATYSNNTAKRNDIKAIYKLIIMVVFAGLFALITDSNFWGWLAIMFFGRFIFEVVLSIVVGIVVYILTFVIAFASIIGIILWIITS